MTARHSPLFTLESGQSGLGIYTSQRDAAIDCDFRAKSSIRGRTKFRNYGIIAGPPKTGMRTEEARALATGKHRPEIDGLRAFAVIAVIINHFNKHMLPGGYLGVDIFFVISGYVITSSLYGRPSKDFGDFITGFYERRIKRLVPALSVFVLITSIAICLFNPSPGLSLSTGLTSLFGLSNLYLFEQSIDYFAQSTELNVFTHTWSLGVEEQFYILFPFLIWLSGFGRQTKNGARNLFLVVSTLTIASLIGFLYLYPTNQPAAYFLMPSRFWELASGCLIFIGFQKRAWIEQLLEKVPPLLALALIVGVMYLPMSMASASTIAVVVLSSILIASLKKETAAFKIFTNPKVVYIGLISYSLYLWHWGVLSISRWTIGIHWWLVPFQVALMLGLAIASYRWIETPLRKGNWFGKRWKTLMVGGGVLVMVSACLTALDKPFKGRLYTGKNADQQILLSKSDCPEKSSEKRMYILGDSHAQQLAPLALQLKSVCGMKTYSKMNTLFPTLPTDVYVGKEEPSAQKLLEKERGEKKIFATLLRDLRKGDIAVISSRYLCRLQDKCFSVQLHWKRVAFSNANGLKVNSTYARRLWFDRLNTFVDLMHSRGVRTILMLPSPEIRQSPALCSSEWFRPLYAISKDCAVPKDVIQSRTVFIDELRLRNINGLLSIDAWSNICNNDSECSRLNPAIDLKDATHISEIAISRFQRELMRKMR